MQNFVFVFFPLKLKKNPIIMALECFMLRIKEDKANDVFKTAGTDFISMK